MSEDIIFESKNITCCSLELHWEYNSKEKDCIDSYKIYQKEGGNHFIGDQTDERRIVLINKVQLTPVRNNIFIQMKIVGTLSGHIDIALCFAGTSYLGPKENGWCDAVNFCERSERFQVIPSQTAFQIRTADGN